MNLLFFASRKAFLASVLSLIVLGTEAGCSKSPTAKKPGVALTTSPVGDNNRPATTGGTTQDTAETCKKEPAASKKDSQKGSDDEGKDEEGDDLDLRGGDRNGDDPNRFGSLRDRLGNRNSGSSDQGNDDPDEDAEDLVQRLCASCHGGASSDPSAGRAGGLFGGLRNRGTSTLVLKDREDLLIRADDIIKEFESPSQAAHRQIRNPQHVVDVFERFQEDEKDKADSKSKKKKCS